MKFQLSALTSILATAPLLLGCNNAPEPDTAASVPANTGPPPAATAPDDTYVTLHGSIVEAGHHGFTLDYGEGTLYVEMDDYDPFPEGRALMEEDQVVVYGYVDADFYEHRSIEASSVYVKNLGTQFYASHADEEDFPMVNIQDSSPRIELSGEIEDVEGREFSLDLESQTITVDTSRMLYNPLDREGFQQLQEGDRVRVTGVLDNDLFDRFEIDAQVIISLEGTGS